MSGIITQGYGDNQLIITQGYGEVIPTPVPFFISTKPMPTEQYRIEYIDVTVTVPVTQLSVAKEAIKVVDISNLIFKEEPLMSWEDIAKFSGNRSKKHE